MEHKPKPFTSAELAVLSLVIERDLHGYEIEAIIQERGMRNWTEIGFSSIYHILGLLERERLIASRAQAAPGKGPARKVYAATPAGRSRYEAEALGALATMVRPYPLFMQGLAALPFLAASKAADALVSYREGLAARLEELNAKDSPALPFHVAALFSYSKAMIGAEEEWVAALERELRSKAEGQGGGK
jgi:DNA-binding PadR family transcriptional regulator